MATIEADVRLLTALSVEERQELMTLMEGHRPMVGVYVHPDFRGQGFARHALDVLLASIALLPPEERPEYFYYETDKVRLFRSPPAAAGGVLFLIFPSPYPLPRGEGNLVVVTPPHLPLPPTPCGVGVRPKRRT